MATLNPLALNLWLVGSAIGYIADGGHGLAWGLAITAGISFVVSCFSR